MTPIDVVLASASPRRRDLLRQIGVRFVVVPAHIDETRRAGEPATDYVRRMALDKAEKVWRESPPNGVPVLGADTAVVLGEDVLGKPADEDDAVAMLMRLSANRHLVLSAVALVGAHGHHLEVVATQVDFRALTAAECRRYWATGEPSDKAGAYAIQGLGAVFVRALTGSYSGVVGLPLAETYRLLRLCGISCWMHP